MNLSFDVIIDARSGRILSLTAFLSSLSHSKLYLANVGQIPISGTLQIVIVIKSDFASENWIFHFGIVPASSLFEPYCLRKCKVRTMLMLQNLQISINLDIWQYI